ncbi:MAG: aspartate kinase [Phycisphaerales bacterium]|nr:aspartate kinase [Phycisphaerales bacterium]
MPLLVQKFGGSSVADPDRIRRCAQRAYDARRRGNDVIVVVSAMGKTTDRLIELAGDVTPSPPKREMDQLLATGEQVTCAVTAMAIDALGQPAVSLTGPQVGFHTDGSHTKARIRSINEAAIRKHLGDGRIVVVAGFQGVGPDGSVTTLGRGGSDTTAVALAAALRAEECEIFTDVDGVYTADPRIVEDARKIERISYEGIIELAAVGAKVMALRSVLLGAKYNVPIHVRHSMLPDAGTMIVPETAEMEHEQVTGVALKTNLGRVFIPSLPNTPGVQGRIFAAIAEANIMVDDIIQNEITGTGAGGDTMNVSFTLEHSDLADIKPVLDRILSELDAAPGRGVGSAGWGAVRVDVGLCKVSAVGVGMRSHTGVAARMFRALAEAESGGGGGGIRIQNITTSEIKISCILAKEDGERALRAVHEAFGLGRPAQ